MSTTVSRTNRADVYTRVTDRIVQELEHRRAALAQALECRTCCGPDHARRCGSTGSATQASTSSRCGLKLRNAATHAQSG